MSHPIISSLQNPRIKHLRRLRTQWGQKGEWFLLEGQSLVQEARARGWEIDSVYQVVNSHIVIQEAPTFQLSERLMQAITTLKHSPGVLAVAKKRFVSANQISLDGLSLVLDGIQDPGNVGALLRSAAAFGVRAVFSTPGTAHFYNPKVVRAAMGAMFHLQLCENVKPETLEAALQAAGAELIYADSHFGEDPQSFSSNDTYVLVLGHETFGVSPRLKEMARRKARIPMAPAVESLNVAIAGSILLYELAKIRRQEARNQCQTSTAR
ncbi:MAG: RNA methyltransferase [Acidobacteria bacterium]|nr:RNA methyltransferase [Acidobacteriota bacterium]